MGQIRRAAIHIVVNADRRAQTTYSTIRFNLIQSHLVVAAAGLEWGARLRLEAPSKNSRCPER